MRRGRGKGKKQNAAAAAAADRGSGEEEKIPAYRRRGRPQKPIKDEIEEEELVEKIEEGDDEINGSITSKDMKNEGETENGRKRKRCMQSKENNGDVSKEEKGVGSKSSKDDSIKSSNGYRQNGSRRKNKPRRAAEAVVECNGV